MGSVVCGLPEQVVRLDWWLCKSVEGYVGHVAAEGKQEQNDRDKQASIRWPC